MSVYIPRPGDIGLTQISGFGGKAIRAAQWLNGDGFSDFEHAFQVESVDNDGTVWIVEAMPGGAQRVVNWHDPATTRWLICPEGFRIEASLFALAAAINKIPYSFADYVSLAAHRFHIPVPRLRAYIKASGHMICSQLVDHSAKMAGWNLFDDGRWEGDVTPGDLNRLWLSLPPEAVA